MRLFSRLLSAVVGLGVISAPATTRTAVADTRPAALGWLIAASDDPDRTVVDLGEYVLDGSGVVALDPLTGYATQPVADLPKGPARTYVIMAKEDGYDYAAALMLVLADGKPVCGVPLGVFGVDTGLAALINRSDAIKLESYARILEPTGSDLFTALETQLPIEENASTVTLPDGTRLPISRSGFGDGAFKLFRLNDAQGAAVALYIDFIGDRKGEWIAPPPCANV